MIISVADTFTHKAVCEKKNMDNEELKQLVFQSIEKIGLDPKEVKWNEYGHLELKQPNNLKLHTLMLKMEELGLDLKMTKQTLIEIC
jgi:hypothetical protein